MPTHATWMLSLVCLIMLAGCQSGFSRDAVDAPLLLNGEVVGLRDRAEAFDGVVAYVRSRKSNADGSYLASEGEDLKLDFFVFVMTRRGAFVREGYLGLKDDDPTRFVGTRIPDDKSWEVINTEGKSLGRLYKDRDDPFSFGATVYGGHARRNWSHVEGHESQKSIRPNSLICCWTFTSDITIPFSEIEPTGEWGTVEIPMWISVYYYDIAERRFERAHRKFDLPIQFQPASEEEQ